MDDAQVALERVDLRRGAMEQMQHRFRLLTEPGGGIAGRLPETWPSYSKLKDANGQVEWIAALIRDVTERYERNKTLRTELATLKAKTAIP
jgi:hypothetical protein